MTMAHPPESGQFGKREVRLIPLTDEDIEKLASRKGVNRVAVENFLSTLGQEGAVGLGRSSALRNLYSDAISYRWTAATVKAIESGIVRFFKR